MTFCRKLLKECNWLCLREVNMWKTNQGQKYWTPLLYHNILPLYSWWKTMRQMYIVNYHYLSSLHRIWQETKYSLTFIWLFYYTNTQEQISPLYQIKVLNWNSNIRTGDGGWGRSFSRDVRRPLVLYFILLIVNNLQSSMYISILSQISTIQSLI